MPGGTEENHEKSRRRSVWKVKMDMRDLYYDESYVGRSVVKMEGAWNWYAVLFGWHL
jgi:hypothetical protein